MSWMWRWCEQGTSMTLKSKLDKSGYEDRTTPGKYNQVNTHTLTYLPEDEVGHLNKGHHSQGSEGQHGGEEGGAVSLLPNTLEGHHQHIQVPGVNSASL